MTYHRHRVLTVTNHCVITVSAVTGEKCLSLSEVLSIPRRHPLYAKRVPEDAPSSKETVWHFTDKAALAEAVEAALQAGQLKDIGPPYWSPSGGSGSGKSVCFPYHAVDNRRMRAEFASMLGDKALLDPPLGPQTVVASIFSASKMCRSLEIFTDLVELAGAICLPIGATALQRMPPCFVRGSRRMYRQGCRQSSLHWPSIGR